jgi:heptosyltransferase I
MKSLTTYVENTIRKTIVLIDYILWILFDFSKFKKVDNTKIKKVLIIHLGAIGELLATTPVLWALKQELHAEITFMVGEGKDVIFKNNPNVDNILIYKKGFKNNLEKIKKESFDLAIILWPAYISMSFMCLMAGIKYRIGSFKNIKDGLNFFFTRRILYLRKNHAIQTNLDVIRLIGIDNTNPKIDFYLSKKEEEDAEILIKKFRLKDYIVVHPGFSFSTKFEYPSRVWSFERYAEVIDSLCEKYKVKVLLSGSEEERSFSEKIVSHLKNKDNAIIINGMTSINVLAAIVSKSKLLIAPSTGIVHLATAFNTKIIQLSGSELVEIWYPSASEKNCKVLFHPEVCTECDKNYCRKKTQECMKSIEVKEVLDAADLLLG